MKRDRFGVRAGSARADVQSDQSLLLPAKKLGWPVLLFVVVLFVPWSIYVGAMRMSLYRLVLLVMVVPCLWMLFAGKVGKVRTADIALLLYTLWCALALFVNHGIGLSLQPAGIGFVETAGAYLLARCYIRDPDDFHNFFSLLFKIVLVLLPFAAVEFFFGKNVWRDTFAAVLPVQVYGAMPPRNGLYRVQMGFDHPILFGMCIGSILAPIYLVLGYQKAFFRRSFKAAVVGAVSLMSLSAGPLIGVFVQGALLAWHDLFRTSRSRWKILTALLVSMGLTIELVANRSLLNVVVTFFVFDDGSYWFRRFIWDYGSASVMKHPLFGIGLNDWERPAWMFGSSIDNFWLFLAVRNGFPGPILFGTVLLSLFLALCRIKNLDDRTATYRTGFLISVVAFFLVAWTVHYWDAGLVWFVFFLGSGVWMLDHVPKKETASEPRGVQLRS